MEVKAGGDVMPQEKNALQSKKFIAFFFSSLVMMALLVAAHRFGPVDIWLSRILAAGIAINSVGYVLGVAALDAVIGRLHR